MSKTLYEKKPKSGLLYETELSSETSHHVEGFSDTAQNSFDANRVENPSSAVIRIAETDEKKVTEETDQVSVVKPNSKLEEDEEGEPLCTIKVTGFSKLTSPDTMLHYFENAKQSGGGYLKDFVGHDEEDYAYVTFEQEDVARRVAKKTHRLNNVDLHVSLYKPRPAYKDRLIIKGVRTSTTKDCLFNFLRAKSGTSPNQMIWGKQAGTVMVIFDFEPEFDKLVKVCERRPLEGIFLKVSKVRISNCILVSDLKSTTSGNTVKSYFETREQSGGGDIEKVKMLEQTGTCLVYFQDYAVLIDVIKMKHRLEGQGLTVKVYVEELGRSLCDADVEKDECIDDVGIDRPIGITREKRRRNLVLNPETHLHKRSKEFEQMHHEAEMLYQITRWHFEQVTNEGTELIPYDKMINLNIETAYRNKQQLIELADTVEEIVYVLDFQKAFEYDKLNKEDKIGVARKDFLESVPRSLPSSWRTMKDNENICIVNLDPSDPKYQKIDKRFTDEVTDGQNSKSLDSIANHKIIKIERIQNKALYWRYMTKKDLMMKQTPHPRPEFPIERKVWHKPYHSSVERIEEHGFHRSNASSKTGLQLFGRGPYFASSASYWFRFCQNRENEATEGYIFLVKALTGKFCQNCHQPDKNPSNRTELYDSVVDDVTNPMEFEIFDDGQAYPKYRITFVSC